MKRTIFAYPYVVWMLIFILSPMLMIAYYAFTSNGAFTLENLTGALTNEMYMQVLLRSIWIALKATAICLLLGYPIAYLLSKMKKSTASLLSVLFIVPMWMNFLLRTYAWQVLLSPSGLLNTLLEKLGLPAQQFLYTESAIMLGTVYNFLPFMILPIYTVLSKMDQSQIEAAHDLGANGPTTFFKVVLRLHPSPAAVGFIYKNQSGNRPKGDYMNTVDEVERITSLDFFSALPDSIEERVEVQLGDFGI